MIRPLYLVLFMLSVPAHVWAATLSLGEQTALTDGKQTLPLVLKLNPGENVAALQADLNFNPVALQCDGVIAGMAAKEAEKSASSNELQPGCFRLVVAGVNDKTIASGIVAEFRFTLLPNHDPTEKPCLSNALLADPLGKPVPFAQPRAAADTPAKDPFPAKWACGGSLIVVAAGLILWRGKKMRSRLFVFCLGAASLLAPPAYPASLDVTDATAAACDINVQLLVNLAPGTFDEVGAIQFDLLFDSFQLSLQTIQAGEVLQEAEKSISFNVVEEGRVNIIIAGFNQNIIQAGTILLLNFNVSCNASQYQNTVSLSGVKVSSIYGASIFSVADPGAIYVEGIGEGEGETPSEGEGEEPSEGEGETPSEGEGETPSEGEGESPSEGEGEEPSEGEGETPSEGEGETPTEGEGETPSEGEGEEPPPPSGCFAA